MNRNTSSCNTPAFFTSCDMDLQATKIHVGCGGIYLRGYINCDVHGEVREQGDPEPEHATSADRYYAGLPGNPAAVPARRPAVVDARCDMRSVHSVANRADKILAVQCLEHLSFPDAMEALQCWRGVLFPGGHAIISVPWAYGSLQLMASQENPIFAVRHLVGTQTGDQYHHRSWYDHSTLATMLLCAGFKSYEFLSNPHFYPALVVRAGA